jgi:hypothetical protein
MMRLPASGVSLMTPCRDKSELKQVLAELCPETTFDDATLDKYYMTLASLIGSWLSEQGRLETEPVKKALLKLAMDLNAASTLLSGLETGWRNDLEIEIAFRVRNLLALNPMIGSAVEERLKSFRQDAATISLTCLNAANDLPSTPEKRGAKKKDWYSLFTKLLRSIAKQAGVGPTLYKDRSGASQTERGWLLDAAHVLETFLPREMRSPSDVARYKRLERSQAASKAGRQNSPAR